jgi:16S rRNA (guanine527-N7)-methyltransferase
MQPEDFQNRFDVSRETLARLQTYHDLLLKWQRAINLVSPATIPEAWNRHFADSAQLSSLIAREARVADLGSGAGFPGLVLAVMRPDLEIHLIESDERKGQFLRTVSRETKTDVKIHTARIVNVIGEIAPQVITARAFASLEEILEATESESIRNPELAHILLKGRGVEQEVEEAARNYSFAESYAPSVTDKDARILTIRHVHKRD